jgi:hypothetical protein
MSEEHFNRVADPAASLGSAVGAVVHCELAWSAVDYLD